MRNYMNRLLFCGVWMFNAAIVSAQTGIETLVVTGERHRGPLEGVDLLDVEELQPSGRTDAADLLQGLSGVQADRRSNYAQDTRVSIRGYGARAAFGVRGLDLLIDGIPLSMPDGQGQFSGVMLDGVTQMSVLKGPVAALYGNGAGGVIHLKSQAPSLSSLSLDSTLDESGAERHHIMGEFSGSEFGARVQAARFDADGIRPHSRAEREQLGAQFYYTFENGVKAQWRFDKENSPLLQDPLGLTQAQWQTDPYQANSSAEFFNTRKSIAHAQHALSFQDDDGDERWQLALWRGDRQIKQYLSQRGDAISSSGGVVDLDRTFSGANGNYSWDFTLASLPTTFTVGGEWAAMDDDRKGFINNAGIAGELRRNEENRAENIDAYAIVQIQASDKWEWLLGARQSRVKFSVDDNFIVTGKNADDSGNKNFNLNSASVASRYHLNNLLSVYASVGEGFETPTLTEMAYSNGDKGFNNSLDAASNQQQEIGIDYQSNKLVMGLAAYSVNTRDELVVDQSTNGRTTYVNATSTQRAGVEFDGRYQINTQLDIRVSLHYLNAEYSAGQFDGLQLPGVAKTNHYVQMNWAVLPNDLLKLSLSGVHRGQVAANDNNLIKAPSYTTYDLAVAGKLNAYLALDWWLKLENLADENVVGSVIVNQSTGRSFEPSMGRNLAAGIKISHDL